MISHLKNLWFPAQSQNVANLDILAPTVDFASGGAIRFEYWCGLPFVQMPIDITLEAERSGGESSFRLYGGRPKESIPVDSQVAAAVLAHVDQLPFPARYNFYNRSVCDASTFVLSIAHGSTAHRIEWSTSALPEWLHMLEDAAHALCRLAQEHRMIGREYDFLSR